MPDKTNDSALEKFLQSYRKTAEPAAKKREQFLARRPDETDEEWFKRIGRQPNIVAKQSTYNDLNDMISRFLEKKQD